LVLLGTGALLPVGVLPDGDVLGIAVDVAVDVAGAAEVG